MSDSVRVLSDGGVMLPCRECGAEIVDGELTRTEIDQEFTFRGERATLEVPARVCPECGEVTPL
jgi:YgiT-type zinc finger domain-containing protein